jgi:SAM-dependent methyltransferase
MVTFKNRSPQAELMDEPGMPSWLLHKNLGELDSLNRFTGSHTLSVKGIKRLMTDKQKIYHIVDIGCGSGDVLKFIARWARSNSYLVKLTGIDINPDAIEYLQKNCKDYPEIEGVASNYVDYLASAPKIDIVHSSLFCHHLSDKSLIELFKYLKTKTCGFVMNDLQRNPVAYFGAWLITHALNGSALSKHDGPVSVLRAFKRKELMLLLKEADIINVTIQWHWTFRYLIIANTNNDVTQ